MKLVQPDDLLADAAIAISVSESPDLAALGLSERHLQQAMIATAQQLLALGATLLYGGDLRQFGFSELLFELVETHRRLRVDRPAVLNYLPWPAHYHMSPEQRLDASNSAGRASELVFLDMDGRPIDNRSIQRDALVDATASQWHRSLTAMRSTMTDRCSARIVLGGRVEGYRGIGPGIAEESWLALKARKPLFVVGGFGGCAGDIAEDMKLGMVTPRTLKRSWKSREVFRQYRSEDLANGLFADEIARLASTASSDEVVGLIIRGLLRLRIGR